MAGSSAPALARPPISLDRSFGIGGKVLTGFGKRSLGAGQPIAMAVEPDGKVVLGTPAPGHSMTLTRLDANGALDTSFGDGGILTTAIYGAAIAVQPNGDIVVAGSLGTAYEDEEDHGEADIAVIRYLPDGELDRSFGRHGLVRLRSSSRDWASGVVIQPSGAIAVVGTYFSCDGCWYERDERGLGLVLGEGNGVVLIRFSPAGKLIGPPTLTTGSAAGPLAVGADGQLAALSFWGGEESNEGSAWALDRYKPDGSLVPSFGTAREGQLVISKTNAIPKSLALEPDGKIDIGGFTAGSGGVARLNADGSPDTSFGVNGAASCPGGVLGGAAPGVSVLPDGRLLVGGESGCGIDRYLTNGVPDPSLGNAGSVNPEPQLGGAPQALAPGPGGTVLAAAADQASHELRVARYLEDGAPDPSFGSGGVVALNPLYASRDEATAILRQPDGKLIAAGTTEREVLALARYLPNGKLDPSYGVNGEITQALSESPVSVTPVALQPDGKLIVADRTHFARFMPDGELDPSFGTAGIAQSAERGETQALALAANGDTYAANLPTFGQGSFVSRYLPDGEPDPSFGSGGIEKLKEDGAASDFIARAIAAQPDGKVLVAGDASGGISLVRMRPNGRPDHSFGEDGVVRARFYRRKRRNRRRLLRQLQAQLGAMALAPNGDIVIGGWVGRSERARPRNGFVARYRPNGSLDRRFGRRGSVRFSRLGINGVGIDRCGRIDMAGAYKQGPGEDLGVAQLSPNGKVLRSSHRSLAGLPSSDWGDNHANALTLTPHGFVAAGVAPAPGQNDQFALASFRARGGCRR